MDIQMPVLDGKEAIKALKKLGYSQPVCALTANVMQSDIEEYRKLGFQDTLAKPLDLEQLYAVLDKHLSSKTKPNIEPKVNQHLVIRLKELKPMFIASLTLQLDELNEAIAQDDFLKMGEILHVIKGSAGSFGFDQLTELASDALLKIRKDQFHLAKPLIRELVVSIEEIVRNGMDYE
jgi:CheY-like chemotaxis protein